MSEPTRRERADASSGNPVDRAATLLAAWGLADAPAVVARSGQVAQGLHEFAARYPAMRPARIEPLALSVTAAAPFGAAQGLISTARVSLWVFAVDDRFDEGEMTRSDLDELVRRCEQVLAGEGADPAAGSLLAALAEVRDDLAGYPLFGALGAGWSAALRGTLAGMRTELDWRFNSRRDGPAAWPTYEDYLSVGRYSIGGPPHIWSSWLTLGDPSTPRHLARLIQMEEVASTCIRLANDLQSHAREQAEGKFNALDLWRRRFELGGLSTPAARDQADAAVRAEIATRLQRLASLSAPPATVSGQPETAIERIARFVCRFYDRHDFHTFASPPSQ